MNMDMSIRMGTTILKRGLALLGAIILSFTMIVPSSAGAYSSSKANAIINTANKYLGTPYKYGATYGSTNYFDCSSFVKYVYAKNGIYLPRVSRNQAKMGTAVSMSNLKKGDLVFFKSANSSSNTITHVAIYAGNNKLLHTYGSGGVKYTSFSTYWKNRFVKARRVI